MEVAVITPGQHPNPMTCKIFAGLDASLATRRVETVYSKPPD